LEFLKGSFLGLSSLDGGFVSNHSLFEGFCLLLNMKISSLLLLLGGAELLFGLELVRILLRDHAIMFLDNSNLHFLTFGDLIEGSLRGVFSVLMNLFGSSQFLLFLLYDFSSLFLRSDGLVESLSVDGFDQVSHVAGLPSHPEH